MNAHSLKGSAVLRSPASGDWVKPLKSGGTGPTVLVVPVRDLKSRESGLDENAYKALNAKENPEIKFTLRSESLAAGRTEGTRGMTAKGDLAVAGVTIPVTLKADAILSKGKIRLKGVHKLKMSDFKITPPSISLLVTAITCTDEIEIHYDVTFAPK
jgi:polyisoprenoid-binding protein YceI